MPLLSRRKAGHVNQMDHSTVASATAAATQAFVQRPSSRSSLSSAAAAAALRSYTSSPEPVGSIQTKRMVRRGSVSSVGSGSVIASGAGQAGPGTLQRSGSVSSMTERTFRTPSPGRVNGAASPPPIANLPPVPAIPAHMAKQRSSSLDMTARPISPTPQRGRRGASAERTHLPPPTNARSGKRLSDVAEAAEAAKQQAGSRNFSRPMSPSQTSPASPQGSGTASRFTTSSGSWHTGPSGNATTGTPKGRSASLDNGPSSGRVAQTAGASARSARGVRVLSGQGSHLAQANQAPPRSQSAMSNRSMETVMVYDPNTRTFVARPKEPERAPEPPSPTSKKPDPGVWDPNTRTFIPRQPQRVSASRVVPVAIAPPPKQRPVPPAVVTTLPPPPKNPARYSPVPSSPPGSPRFDGMHRQPSTVMEDPEAEKQAEATLATPKPKQDTSVAVPSSREVTQHTPKPVQQQKATLVVPAADAMPSTPEARNTSVSPQRSAHFSVSPVVGPGRHVPPPRDISPVKSALKQHSSPASSDRANSPMPPPSTSDINDNASDVGSQDGLSASARKRKNFRVSFDEQASAMAIAAARPMSPASDEDGEEAFMKPRPTLPSFGSVRKNRMQPELAEKVTEIPPERHSTSSDNAIGGILKKLKPERERGEPLPPEVTSKESTGYQSDNSSDDEVPLVAVPNVKLDEAPLKEPAIVPASDTLKAAEHVDVPDIALLPPSPGTDESSAKALGSENDIGADSANVNRNSMEGIILPGGWNTDNGVAANVSQQTPATVAPLPDIIASELHLSDIDEQDSDDDAEFSDAAEDLSELDEGGFASLDAIVESPLVTPVKLRHAPETEAEAEPDDTPSKPAGTEPSEPDRVVSPSAADGDWSEATAYWSKLSKQQREKIEMEHLQSDDETHEAPVIAVKQPAKKKVQPTAKDIAAVRAAETKAPPVKPAMKKSMRPDSGASGSDGAQLRQSMRTTGTMAKTMRGPAPLQAQSDSRAAPRATRPLSAVGTSTVSAGLTNQTLRPRASSFDDESPRKPKSKPIARAPPPQVSTRLTKELAKADDSDSDTSFRRRRRAGSNATLDSQNKYNMRRSMRGGFAEPAPASPVDVRPTSPTPSRRGKGSFLRSLSPSGSLFGRNKGDKAKNKTSLRDSGDAGRRTTLRSKPAPRGSTTSSAPRHKSRFADSDDEDDAPRAGLFRSRFADSDDDEPLSPVLSPVRGIPRRQGRADGDSTDLSDSDADDVRRAARWQKSAVPAIDPDAVEKAMAAARRNLGLEGDQGNGVKEGDALQKRTLRTETPPPQTVPPERPRLATATDSPEQKRRSFVGSILRRNRGSTSSIPQTRVASPPPPMPTSPIQSNSTILPSSPTRGKLVRRQSSQARAEQLAAAKAQVQVPTNDPESWPLPPPIPDDTPNERALDRPNTSDGIAGKQARSLRPNIQRRSVSGQEVPSAASNRVRIQAGEEGTEPGERAQDAARSGKKKRFGLLRRAFKLDD